MTPKMATDKVNAPAVSQLAGEIAVRQYAIRICDACIALKGEMCSTPECVFCWRTLAEVGEILNATLLRPLIDGERLDVEYAQTHIISAALSERESEIRRETFNQCREIAMGMTGPGNTPEQCQGYSDACCDIGKAFKKLALGE